MEIPKKGFTHAGSFHSDDVFATAFLRILNPDFTVERGFEAPEDFDGIVYDIGRGEFDHHQEGKEYRENGCPYAAFGLVFREFGTQILDKEDADSFDEIFIQPLDESDNTGSPNELAELIDDFNPTWDMEKDFDRYFFEAVTFAEEILRNRFRKIKSNKKADGIVKKALEECDGKILVLDPYVPWKFRTIGSGYQFVVYASNRGGYNVQGVPVRLNTTELVCAFPEEWRGKENEDLAEISGISGLRFCHPSGFLVAAETKEAAILAAKKAMGE